MWVGESESKIRGLFSRAREHFEENGFPALIFLDEADAILGKRGLSRGSSISETVVPQFLSEMDGLGKAGQPLVLIATNRPDILDPAVVRDGRVDRKVKVERPGAPEVHEIFSINLKGKPQRDDELADHGTRTLMCDSQVLFQLTDEDGKKHHMTLAHAVNGAMVSGIVDRATELAMRRELEGEDGRITRDDLSRGISENRSQMADIDLTDEIEGFAESRRIRIVEAQRVA
jgi:proteasome-associated ATPase